MDIKKEHLMINSLKTFFSENEFNYFTFCSKNFIINLNQTTINYDHIFVELLEISKNLDRLQIDYTVDDHGNIHLLHKPS